MPPRSPCSFISPGSNRHTRHFPYLFRSAFATAKPPNAIEHQTPPAPSNDARWLSGIKTRIGKCIMFGMGAGETRKAVTVLKALGDEWRELVAGKEGFLTDEKSAGLRRQKVVWGEMDSMGHVNNVMYIRYAESARVNWIKNYATYRDPHNRKQWAELMTPRGHGLILKSILTEFKFPMTWPDHISVFHKLRSLPSPTDSNFILDVMILSERHQRPSARCVEDIVTYDYRIGKKVHIPPFMMDAFMETWEMQSAERQRIEKRRSELESTVVEIEKATWDQVGAIEDLGGAR